MKKMKYLIMIIILSLIITFGITFSLKGQVHEYGNSDFKIKYDNTWKMEETDKGVLLVHKKSNSKVKIQCKVLETKYIDTKLNDIISDIMASVEKQNNSFKLISKLDSFNSDYESYAYLYEYGMEQALVSVFKKDNKLVIAYFHSNSEYYDIVLDSVENILNSLEIVSGEKVN